MRRVLRALPLILLLTPLLAGCEMMRDLGQLSSGLARAFPGGTVNVNINNDALAVTFLNLPLSETEEQREVLARRVAEHVRDHYDKYDDLSSISVRFGTRMGTAALNTTRTGRAYTFTPEQLAAPATPDSAAGARTSAASAAALADLAPAG
jgi:hypothetical protein